MATYVPNATDSSQPTASQTVESAAAEFRTLKTRVNALETVMNAEDVKDLRVPELTVGLVPPATTRAGKVLGFDAGGNPVAVAVAGTTDPSLRADLAASSGTSLVGFLQAGTGAVARTAQSKMRECVSVTDFGADPNGASDSTAAIQAAFNAAAITNPYGTFRKNVYFPAGFYLVTNTITVPRGVAFFGEGIESTTIRADLWSGTLGNPIFSASTAPNFRMSGMNINGRNKAAGVLLVDGYGNTFHQVRFTECHTYGLKLTEAASSVLDQVELIGTISASHVGVLLDGGSNTMFRNCSIGVVGGTGVKTTQANYAGFGSSAEFLGCSFHGGGTAVEVLRGQGQFNFQQCYWEGDIGQTLVPLIYGLNGTGAVENLSIVNSIIANANTANFTIQRGQKVTFTGNVTGRNVTFAVGIGNLFFANNNFASGATYTNSVGSYVDMQNVVGGTTNDGRVNFGNQDITLNWATAFGALSINTASGWSGNDRVVFGNASNAALTTGLYLRGNGADVDVVSAGAPIALGTTTTQWAKANSTSFIPGADASFTLGASGSRWTDVWATNGTIQTSDERKKKDIEPCDLGLDFVNALRPVSYRWIVGDRVIIGHEQVGEERESVKNEDGTETEVVTPITKPIYENRPGKRKHYGLIAQQVRETLQGADFAGLIHDQENDHMGLRYEQLIAPLIKAVQELSARVAALENK